jgi:hypothetical protein
MLQTPSLVLMLARPASSLVCVALLRPASSCFVLLGPHGKRQAASGERRSRQIPPPLLVVVQSCVMWTLSSK